MSEEQFKEPGETEPADKTADQPGAPEEKGSRMDAAKAFFRAMNAGEVSVGGEPAAPAASAQRLGPCAGCQLLESQLKEAEQKSSEWEILYKRMAADFDNYRRRTDKERDEFHVIGTQRAIEAILPALDDMDRAISSLSADVHPDKLLESLKLVYNRINRCIEQIGVKPMAAVGAHFDPKYHEPVQEIETSDFPDGSVMQELRRGYTLNDRVIRPALVNVASNTGQANTAPHPAVEAAAEEEEPVAKVYDLSEFEDSDDGTDRPDASQEKAADGPRVETGQ